MVYSLFGTCKMHGLNPEVWLADVIARIPTHPALRVAELSPHRWQPLQPATLQKKAA